MALTTSGNDKNRKSAEAKGSAEDATVQTDPADHGRSDDSTVTDPQSRASGKASGAAGADAGKNDDTGRTRTADNMPERVTAAESSDPTVHQILAEQDIAWQNGDAEGVREANRRLNELGYK